MGLGEDIKQLLLAVTLRMLVKGNKNQTHLSHTCSWCSDAAGQLLPASKFKSKFGCREPFIFFEPFFFYLVARTNVSQPRSQPS